MCDALPRLNSRFCKFPETEVSSQTEIITEVVGITNTNACRTAYLDDNHGKMCNPWTYKLKENVAQLPDIEETGRENLVANVFE